MDTSLIADLSTDYGILKKSAFPSLTKFASSGYKVGLKVLRRSMTVLEASNKPSIGSRTLKIIRKELFEVHN